MEVKKTGTGLKVLVVVLSLLVLALTGYILIDKEVVNIKFGEKVESNSSDYTNTQNKNSNSDSQTITTKETNKSEGGFIFEDHGGDTGWNGYGKARITGYAKTEKLDSENESENLVFFYILESNDSDFNKYINSFGENSFVKGNDSAFSLGCLKDNKIVYHNSYTNDNSELEDYASEISEEDTTAILSSTKEKPITLDIEKLKVLSGTWSVSLCYSHMTYINVIK